MDRADFGGPTICRFHFYRPFQYDEDGSGQRTRPIAHSDAFAPFIELGMSEDMYAVADIVIKMVRGGLLAIGLIYAYETGSPPFLGIWDWKTGVCLGVSARRRSDRWNC